jgi:patatin-related protein
MRFAIVLYGGVSLAIYINGVVQEFLRLVRATAPSRPTSETPDEALLDDDALTGSERVYRKLGQLVEFGRVPDVRDVGGREPIRTRFVVDVLSGSSAGGINGIFLAKALAGELDIDQLSRLWVEQGDIGVLVNDAASLRDVPGLVAQRPPRSLLNSERMYWELLSALDGMGPDRSDASRLVDELDLWITTTDIRGLLLPLELLDRVVFEPRYKNVLHFRYGSAYATGGEQTRDELGRRFNPLLAFAARATSSFPFAFDPMALDDVEWAVAASQFGGAYEGSGARSPDWTPFFADYVRGRRPYAVRTLTDDQLYRSESFGDGGYLDNKPFTWATGTLSRRRADHPVDRRLVYIEPDPSAPPPLLHPAGDEDDAGGGASRLPQPWSPSPDRLGAIANVRAALLGLPRTETIRDDLDRLLERNREIRRVRRLADVVDEISLREPELLYRGPPLETWLAQPATAMLAQQGPQYAAYHRLKVAGVLDDLAELVLRLLDLRSDSAEAVAVRRLLPIWFGARYPEGEPGEGQQTQNEFLFHFDTRYRLRRLNYVDARIERLLRLDVPAVDFLRRFAARDGVPPETEVEIALRAAKRRVTGVFVALRGGLRGVSADPEVRAAMAGVATEQRTLVARLLEAASAGAGADDRVDAELLDRLHLRATLDDLADRLADKLAAPLVRAGDAVAAVLAGTDSTFRDNLGDRGVTPAAVSTALAAVGHFYRHYESYDAVLFPAGYGIVDEADPVEVIRISPQDATSLIDETDPRSERRKLGGVAVQHFGGFFEALWRKNDILWGRLDAAERIIESVLPPSPGRSTLLTEAQRAIIAEELAGDHGRLLRQALPDDVLPRPASDLLPPLTDEEAERVRVHLATEYEVSRLLDQRFFGRVLGRSTSVSGRVLVGSARGGRWARLGVRTAVLGARVFVFVFRGRLARRLSGSRR